MLQWKERLYAFLIQRFVGPWLDEESSQRLYQSIDVSIQDGIFVLRDVSLATEKLTSLLQHPVRIRKATIDKLEIHLSLEEHGQQEEEQQQPQTEYSVSSLAYRAFKLGSAHTPGAFGLVVQILVEGIRIEIEPAESFVRHVPRGAPDTSTDLFSFRNGWRVSAVNRFLGKDDS